MIKIKASSKENIPLPDRKKAYDIVITAYALTEIEVWGPNYVRISFEDYNELFERGEILIAYWNNQVAGAIHYYERKKGLYAFSLLGADFDLSGNNIGRNLVEQVEEIALKNEATAIQLEILRPRAMEVPFKVRIGAWYERMGYKYTHSEDFLNVHPIKGQNLVTPCDFDYYWKEL